MQLVNLEEVCYASGPENLEHTTEPPIQPDLVGKKRPRRRTKKQKGEEPAIRKKSLITKCPHTDQKYYAKDIHKTQLHFETSLKLQNIEVLHRSCILLWLFF